MKDGQITVNDRRRALRTVDRLGDLSIVLERVSAIRQVFACVNVASPAAR